MSKKFIIILIAIILGVVLMGWITISKKQISSLKEEIDLQTSEKKGTEEKTNVPSYPKAVIDEDKCGKTAFYVEEKSVDFVKNYCKFLREKGWRLVHQDYSDCEDIKSFGGGYNYEKGVKKLSVSVIKYGEDATCFWVNIK